VGIKRKDFVVGVPGSHGLWILEGERTPTRS
jgi:hypothetical protein